MAAQQDQTQVSSGAIKPACEWAVTLVPHIKLDLVTGRRKAVALGKSIRVCIADKLKVAEGLRPLCLPEPEDRMVAYLSLPGGNSVPQPSKNAPHKCLPCKGSVN